MNKAIVVIKTGEPFLAASFRFTRALYLSHLSASILPTTFITSSYDHHTETNLQDLNDEENPYTFYIKTISQIPYQKRSYLSRLISSHLAIIGFISFLFLKRSSISLIICAFPTPELAAAASLFARLFDIRFVLDVRDMWPEVFSSFLNRKRSPLYSLFFFYYRLLKRISVSLSDLILTGSTFYSQHLKVTTSSKVLIFPVMNIAKPYLNNVAAEQARLGSRSVATVDRHPIRVVFCGTLGNSNVLKPLLDELVSYSNYPDKPFFHFTFYGGGEKYEHYSANCSQYLSFKGWTAQTPSLLSQYDLALLPYHPTQWYREFLGNKYFECLDACLPVLLSHGDGLAYDIINRYQLGLSYNHSPKLLFKILASLYEEPALLEQLRSNIRSFYPLFLRYRRLKEFQLTSRLSSLINSNHG